MRIYERAFHALNLKYFNALNRPVVLDYMDIDVPKESCYILRMLIKRPDSRLSLPKELAWVYPLINAALKNQALFKIRQPFIYLTIRSGYIQAENNDVWHTDGFSMRISHIPEQNYGWCSTFPTEYTALPIKFPKDFNPLVHNIHSFIQNEVEKNNSQVKSVPDKTLFLFDPYVIHRRPVINDLFRRTFVRISFCPIEIEDKNNTINPLLMTNYLRDGVKEFRDKLKDYTVK